MSSFTNGSDELNVTTELDPHASAEAAGACSEIVDSTLLNLPHAEDHHSSEHHSSEHHSNDHHKASAGSGIVVVNIASGILKVFFVGLSLWSLWEQNKKLKALEKADLSSGFKCEIPGIPEYRRPNLIKDDLVKSTKKLMVSEGVDAMIGVILIASVILTLTTGGLGAAVIGFVAAAAAAAKMLLDYHVENKQKDQKIELFTSKVLNTMTDEEVDIYRKLHPEAQIHFLAKKGIKSGFSNDEIKDYILNSREGYFENAKLRNTKIVLSLAGIVLGIIFTILTAGIPAGIAVLAVSCASAAAVFISDTPFISNFLEKKGISEFFRTSIFKIKNMFSKNNNKINKFDYKNLSVNDYLKKLKNDSIISFEDIQNLNTKQKAQQEIELSSLTKLLLYPTKITDTSPSSPQQPQQPPHTAAATATHSGNCHTTTTDTEASLSLHFARSQSAVF